MNIGNERKRAVKTLYDEGISIEVIEAVSGLCKKSVYDIVGEHDISEMSKAENIFFREEWERVCCELKARSASQINKVAI